MAVIVRTVTEADLPALRKHQVRPELNLVDEHFAEARAGTLIFAVALDGEEPLGTALLDFGPEAVVPELRNMFVYPHARRRGAGRALTSWIEDQARAAGYREVHLAVDPNNEKAIPLYVSLDYLPTGEHLLVESPEVPQVGEDLEPSSHYAIYKKALFTI
ncbi:MAG: GNAT family N-acetyltransferase [Propionibacteriaceae bacterium]|nr:GNAT family N-acetyltransferase [Propionibacteriaceae bacterium]MDO5066882.1 GNAT family N-acetyltransferase [Propionibacteriaceae bacterium]